MTWLVTLQRARRSIAVAVLATIFASAVAVVPSSAQIGFSPCSRDGTVVTCDGAWGGIAIAPEAGLDPTPNPDALATDVLNVEVLGPTGTGSLGAGIFQRGDIEVNVAGKRDSFIEALKTAAGDDNQISIAEFRAVIAEDDPEDQPAAEIVNAFLELLGSATEVDTSNDTSVVSFDDLDKSLLAFGRVLNLELFAGEDGDVSAEQLFNLLPRGLDESTVETFFNGLGVDEPGDTVPVEQASQALQQLILDGNVGIELDPGSIHAEQPDFIPGAAAIAGVSGRGEVKIDNSANLHVTGNNIVGIAGSSATNQASIFPFATEQGPTGGPVTITNSGDIRLNGQPMEYGNITATGISAQSGDALAGVIGPFVAMGETDSKGFGGAAVSVENTGDITADVDAGDSLAFVSGIDANSNGGAVNVSNSGDIDLLSRVKGDIVLGDGIFASGTKPSNISVTNSGSIRNRDDGILAFQDGEGFGVDAGPAGDVSIDNSGDIYVVQGSGLTAIGVGKTEVHNTGDITLEDSNRAAIAAQNDAANTVSITNAGKLTINGEGSVGIAGFSANDDDVDAPGKGTVTIDNAGEITVSGGSNAGISGFTGEGGTAPSINITTSANVTAKDKNSSGIFTGAFETPGSSVEVNIVGADTTVHGGAGSQIFGFLPPPEAFDEQETIVGSAGIMMLGGGTTLINNAGTITAENGQAIRAVDGTLTVFDFVVDEDGFLVFDPETHAPLREAVDLDVAAADDTVSNSGTIAGDINLGNGANTVDNKTGGTITGDVNAGVGDDTYTNAGTHTGDVNLANDPRVMPGDARIAADFPGDIVTDDLVEVLSGGPEMGDDTYQNSGTHTGDTRLGFGNNKVSNRTGGSIEGDVIAGLGDDTYVNEGTHVGDVDLSNPVSVTAVSRREPNRKISLTVDSEIMSDNDSYENAGTHTGDVNLGAGNNTLKNSGTLTGAVASISGDDTFDNSGELTGDVTAGDGTNVFSNLVDAIFNGNFFGGGDQDTVTNKGGQVGDVDLGDGTNSFTNEGGFQGKVVAGSGDDTVINSGLFDGTANLGGGSNSFTNAADGQLASGDLFDIGVGNEVVNAGILFPGGTGTIQTTRVSGNFVQRSTGVFEVDVDDRNKFETDQINVVGSADLAGTVVPNVIHLSDVNDDGEAINHAFTIVTATDGVKDSGLLLNVKDTIGFDFDLVFAENGTDLLLTAVASPEVAPLVVDAGGTSGTQGGNGLAAVTALDSGAKTSPALKQLANALRNQTDAASLKRAVERLTPKTQSAQVGGALSGSAALGNAMLSCATRDGEYAYTREGQCYWGKVTVRNLDRDATTGHSGVDEDGVAFSAGIQIALQNEFRLGFGLSYETTDSTTTSQTQTLGKTEGDRFQAGVVLKNQWGPVNAYLNILGGYGSFDHTRFGVLATNTADQDVKTFMTRLRLSYLYALGVLNVRPMVDFNATYIGLDGYTETGAGALTVADADEWFLSVTPTLEIAGEIRSGSTILRPYVRGGVTFIDQDSISVQTNFAAAPAGVQPFTVNADLEDTFAVVEAGLHVLSESGFNLRFTYDGRYGEDSQEHAGSLKASKNF